MAHLLFVHVHTYMYISFTFASNFNEYYYNRYLHIWELNAPIQRSPHLTTTIIHDSPQYIIQTITITPNGNYISQVVHIIRKHMQALYTIEATKTERVYKKIQMPNSKTLTQISVTKTLAYSTTAPPT